MNFKSNKLIRCSCWHMWEGSHACQTLQIWGKQSAPFIPILDVKILFDFFLGNSDFFFSFFFFWYSKLYVHGKSKTRNTNFFTTFIITYWVNKVSYQVVIGEILLLYELITNTNFILYTNHLKSWVNVFVSLYLL